MKEMLTKSSHLFAQSVQSMSEPSTFEKELAEHGRIVYPNVGDSMMPLIKQGRDLLVIESVKSPINRGDIPLYKRDNGRYVLHRVISTKGGKYKICGDNRIAVEHGIEDRHILGVLVAILRDGKELPIRQAEGRFYRFYMCKLFWLKVIKFKFRALWRKFKGLFKKSSSQKGEK